MSIGIFPVVKGRWLTSGLLVAVLVGLAGSETLAQTTQPAAASQPTMVTHEQLVKQASKEPLITEEYRTAGKPLSEEQIAEVEKAKKLMDTAVQARWEGKYSEAGEACDNALATYKQTLGQDHYRTITATLLSRTLATFKSASPDDQKKLAEADKLEKAAKTAHDAGDYRAALKDAQQALQIREAVLGKEHPENVVLLRMIGNEYTELGLLSEAEVNINRALELANTAFGSQHPNTAVVLDRQGWLRINQGKVEDAVQSLSRAVRIYRNTTGESAEMAEALDNLGTALVGMRDQDRALMSKLRAYVIRLQLLGPEDKDTAVSLSNLAWLYGQVSRMDQKDLLTLRQQAHAIFKKALGPEHAWTFLEAANLARQYVADGNTEEGIKLYENMIQSDQTHPEKLDQRMVDRLINLGALYFSAGRFDDGRRLLGQASESNKELYAKGDVDAAIAQQDNLTSVYQNWRMYDDAAQAGDLAIAWAQKRGDPQDGAALARLVRQGFTYKELGRLEEAKRVLEDAVRRAAEDSAKDPLRPINAQLLLCSVLEKLGQLAEAERTCDQALRTTESSLPRKARGQAYPLVAMGRIQTLQKHYELARFSLEEAVNILEKEENRRVDPAGLVNALVELAACRLAEGNKAQAIELSRQALSQTRGLISGNTSVNAKALLIDVLKRTTDALKADLPSSQKECEALLNELKKLLAELRDAQALSAEHKQWLKELQAGADKD